MHCFDLPRKFVTQRRGSNGEVSRFVKQITWIKQPRFVNDQCTFYDIDSRQERIAANRATPDYNSYLSKEGGDHCDDIVIHLCAHDPNSSPTLPKQKSRRSLISDGCCWNI